MKKLSEYKFDDGILGFKIKSDKRDEIGVIKYVYNNGHSDGWDIEVVWQDTKECSVIIWQRLDEIYVVEE